jgi:N-acetyl sugar amidotransferase
MDTTDPDIAFDASGRCNHCRGFDAAVADIWFPNAEGELRLERMIERIKHQGKGKEYDCILGLSGGVDSSYVALKAFEWGLRPLVVHVDAGWNSETAVQNIQAIVEYCSYDLHTRVIDWPAMRRLQLAYLRSGIGNQDVPQDHAFFAGMYDFAKSEGIRFTLTGYNVATESVAPRWHGTAMDAISIKAIFDTYGDGSLDGYPLVSFHEYYIGMPFIRRMRALNPLNLLPYDPDLAAGELADTVGWKPYGRKHGESHFTRWFQNHYLPVRLGFDKRLPHYSSRILSGTMTREEALDLLEQPLYEANELERDKEFIARKLRLSVSQLEDLLNVPTRSYEDFPNWSGRFGLLKGGQEAIAKLTNRRIRAYS